MNRLTVVALILALFSATTRGESEAPATPARGNDWAAYVEGLVPLGEELRQQLPDPNDPLLVQELYRHMYMIVSQGYGGLVYQDAEHPDFWPQFSTMYNYAIVNTDDTYYTVPVDPRGVYKVTGYRGTALMVDFQIGSEQFFHTGLGKLGPPLANYDIGRDVTVDKNGYFEVILSATRPKGHTGNWLELKPQATHLFVRQIFYDWDKEISGRYSIDRLDVPAAPPRQSAERIASQLRNIPVITRNWVKFALDHGNNLRGRGMINQLAIRDFSDAGGVSTQTYMDGLFDIRDDEALILEMAIPDNCYYWGFVVYDELWQAIDWLNRQSSLNGHYAKLDRDGKFRAVISARDPGVPNWLDTGGYLRGGVFGRFNRCPGELKPTVQRVKLAELREHLPKDTPRVTAEERDATMRARRTSIQLRARW